jgi:dienelactone hydrolase
MKSLLLSCLLLTPAAFGQSSSPASPQTVDFPSGNVYLKAYFWKPSGPGPFPVVLFNHGSGGEDAAHTAGMPITEAAERLAPLFLKHGYAFLYPFRRGQGLSSDQAPFMQDLLKREEAAHGTEARGHLQDGPILTDHLQDVLAALSFLKARPDIDPHRIAIAGHSFGGLLTLLAVEREPAARAAVTFAAAANSWGRSAEIRERLRASVGETSAQLMLIYAENDFSTEPGKGLDEELTRLHKPHVLKIYPPVGKTRDEGHNLLYLAISQWESDVFQFLDRLLKPPSP